MRTDTTVSVRATPGVAQRPIAIKELKLQRVINQQPWHLLMTRLQRLKR
jgi:hypothetical protein